MFSFKLKTKYYSSIENLPVWNWFRINETNDLNYLVISGVATQAKLVELWDKIYCEFIDTFGISPQFRNILQLQKDITVLKINNAIGDGRSENVFIKIKQEELNKLISNTNANNINDLNTHLKRFLGYNINQKEVSVKEYYQDLNTFLKSNKSE